MVVLAVRNNGDIVASVEHNLFITGIPAKHQRVIASFGVLGQPDVFCSVRRLLGSVIPRTRAGMTRLDESWKRRERGIVDDQFNGAVLILHRGQRAIIFKF